MKGRDPRFNPENDFEKLERSLRAKYHRPQADPRFVAGLERLIFEKSRRRRLSGWRQALDRWGPVLLWAPLAAFAVVCLYGFLYLFGPFPAPEDEGQPVAMAPSMEPTLPVDILDGSDTSAPPGSPLPYGGASLVTDTPPSTRSSPLGTPVQVFAPTVTPQPGVTEGAAEAPQQTVAATTPGAEVSAAPEMTAELAIVTPGPETPGVGGGAVTGLEAPAGTQPAVTQIAFQDLVVALHALDMDPRENEALLERGEAPVLPEAQDLRAPLWNLSAKNPDLVNETINRFGFSLQGEVLYRGDAPLLTGVRLPDRMPFPGVTLTGDEKDFGLALERGTDETFLVTRDRVLRAVPSPEMDRLQVVENRRVIFGASIAPGSAGVVRGFWNWDGSWVLELVDRADSGPVGSVFVNGEPLRDRLNAEEVFGWWLLDGKPFFFFRRDGLVQISYAGEILEPAFERVFPYDCCGETAFAIQGDQNMVWFYAQKDGRWYIVEAGVYE